MIRFEKYKNHGIKTINTREMPNELKTRQGLAMTPADVSRLTSQGLPVNMENANLFNEGSPNPTPYVTSERRRGVDVADLWEEHQQIIKKAKQAYYESKKVRHE